MSFVTLTDRFKHPFESTWANVEPGDLISYDDGSLFYVDDFGIKEPNGDATLLVVCVVEPAFHLWLVGVQGMMAVNTRDRLPSNVMIFKR